MARKKKPPEEAARRAKVARGHEKALTTNKQVRAIMDAAMERAAHSRPTLDELIGRLDVVYEAAMLLKPPQLAAATAAVLASAKLQGMLIEKSVSVTGTPDDFVRIGSREEEERKAYERIRERHGTIAADRFMRALEFMKQEDDGEVIEGSAEDDNGEDV
jgi:hypothetical protein